MSQLIDDCIPVQLWDFGVTERLILFDGEDKIFPAFPSAATLQNPQNIYDTD